MKFLRTHTGMYTHTHTYTRTHYFFWVNHCVITCPALTCSPPQATPWSDTCATTTFKRIDSVKACKKLQPTTRTRTITKERERVKDIVKTYMKLQQFAWHYIDMVAVLVVVLILDLVFLFACVCKLWKSFAAMQSAYYIIIIIAVV